MRVWTVETMDCETHGVFSSLDAVKAAIPEATNWTTVEGTGIETDGYWLADLPYDTTLHVIAHEVDSPYIDGVWWR